MGCWVYLSDAEIETANHFVNADGRLTIQLHNLSGQEEVRITGKVIPVANEFCGSCLRNGALGLGHFDKTIFAIPEWKDIPQGGLQGHGWSAGERNYQADRIAQTPEEVETIIWFVYREEKVGSYENGHPATKKFVNVSIINAKSGTILVTKEFSGSDPPKSITPSGVNSVRVPSTKAIGEWLATFPW